VRGGGGGGRPYGCGTSYTTREEGVVLIRSHNTEDSPQKKAYGNASKPPSWRGRLVGFTLEKKRQRAHAKWQKVLKDWKLHGGEEKTSDDIPAKRRGTQNGLEYRGGGRRGKREQSGSNT